MFAEVVTIEAVERLRNSRNGNPRFAITYKLAGQSSTLNTAADAAFSYEIGNPGLRVGDVVTIGINGRGTIGSMEARS